MHIHPISCGFGYAFLIETNQGLYLVDSGIPGQQGRVLRKMKALGRADLKLIWVTHAHYDHYGSAASLREITGALIGVHAADGGSMAAGQSPLGATRSTGRFYNVAQPVVRQVYPLPPTPPDFTLADGETLEHYGLNATILFTPGHTPGHTCLLLEDGTAFVGDLISSYPSPRVQSLLATDWGQLPGSLARLQSARPKWLYTGHSRFKMPGERLMKMKARDRIKK